MAQKSQICFIGVHQGAIPDGVFVVNSDHNYVMACHGIRAGECSVIWARQRVHFEWLKTYSAIMGIEASFVIMTPRLLLADAWQVELPDWLEDEVVEQQGLLQIEVPKSHPRDFARTALVTLLGDVFADIQEGQRGVSYEKLFNPYLKGASMIKLVDPYIRYDYQIHNLMSFCEFLAPTEGHIELHLTTSCDSHEQEVELSVKLDELQENLARNRIVFKYDLKNDLHDRWIETDDGWRIMLGRGLDFFQKPEGRFTLGFIDQTKRRCKATTITITRK